MKKLFGQLRSRGVALNAVVLAVSFTAVSANAALPTWATGIVTDAGTAGTDAAASVGPVIGAVMVSLIVIKLVKRFANKI